MATPTAPLALPLIKIKEEPEDDYDYSKSVYNPGVQVKQEESDDDITDNYSHSDDDYPILERHFAQFSTKRHSNRKHPVRSPSGVAKAKLLKLDDGKMPMVYLESCSTNNTTENVSNSQALVSTNKTIGNIKQEEFSEVFPGIVTCKTEEVCSRIDEKRQIKRKIYADYAVPVNVRSNRGCKKKPNSVPAKSKPAVTPKNESGVAPVPKRRGRPPKNKGAKVGRPPKKKPPIETPQFPDFKPDLEDVDGVLFVAFSSKEALDVHTVGKPKVAIPAAPPQPPVHVELTEEQQKIVNLERQLLVQLKAMRHRQVIHPALQQVGLRLNIVDHAMSIDLRYLGVELPLPFITCDSKWDNCGISSEGLPFVSRTGKTTDYTKIKGWRDKFSSNPLVKSEAGCSETTLKNRSAFCSDELDEYLENEAKLMEDIRGTSQTETVVSTVSFQFPTKSASYVRTLDSVLKKQATSNSQNISKPPSPLPVKKRKYTRRTSTPKTKSKIKPILPSPVECEKPVKSAQKPKSPKTLKSTPSPNKKTPVTSQPRERSPLSEQPIALSPGEDNLWSRINHNPFHSPHFTQRSTGVYKVQMKLLELEKSAVSQGKPRTYVTEERAEIALSALLTIQGFLKNKPFHKVISKRTPSCKNEFCRLGCICSSLNHTRRKPSHCQQEACMFGCDCVKSKLCLSKDGLNTSMKSGQSVGEDVKFPTENKPGASTHGAKRAKHANGKKGVSVLGDESNNQGIKAMRKNSKDSADRCSKRWPLRVFPIWDRSDVDNDPEPVCIPEKGEVFESKIPYHRRQSERSKSSTSKSSPLHTPRASAHPEDLNAEDLHHFNSMTCARVRVFKPKATEQTTKKDRGSCANSETPGKENSHKPNKYREQEKENAGDSEIAEKKQKKTDSSAPTKLLKIISDCSWEEDPKKILNIVSQHVDNKEPQSFRVGSFNIELTSENKDGDASKSSATSRVKISMAPDQISNPIPAKPPPVKGKTENIKLPVQIPLETNTKKETKSHGGKGLPFYTKVIPAGKLVARLNNSTLNRSELIQVNGKTFPQAKLLLGQMGALHPANRIAAYVTHRLRPSLLYLSKANEASAKTAADIAGPESSAENENSKALTDEENNAVASPQSKTVLPSTPNGDLTHFDMGEVGSLKQKSPEVLSPEPTEVGLPKMHTQSSPLVLVSTPVSSSSALTVVSSSSENMVSTTPPLSSGAVSPYKNQAASIPTILIGATKLVKKDSSLPVTTTLSNDTTNSVSLTSSPSPKCVSIPPPALIRAPCPPVTSSSVTPSAYPGTNKTLAASVASSLVASANVPTIGLVNSPTGRPTVTLRTVTSPSVTTRASLTSGHDKRLGPRLLLIPVANGSAPVRPVQCVQTSPGQKMVLQPIKGPNGINLFRHPNGQIIQLLPLQQIQAANVQQSQRVVIRSPGATGNIQLPIKNNTDVSTPTCSTTGSSSVPPAPPLQSISLSKMSPVKSGVTAIPTSPSQIATLRIGTPPRVSSEVSPSGSKVVAYASSSCGVITSTGVPLQTGGLPVLKCATTTAQSSITQDSATKPKVILMTGKPAVLIDGNKLANVSFFKSAKIVLSSEKNADREKNQECKELFSMETDNEANLVENQSTSKASVASVEQDVFTPSVEQKGEVEKRRIPTRRTVDINESEKSDTSSGTWLQDTNIQDSLSSSQKISSSSTDKEDRSPRQTVTASPTVESDHNGKNPETQSDQDPENDKDTENPMAKSMCLSLEQDCEQAVESASSTVQVQPVACSEVDQQTQSKSEHNEKENTRKSDLVTGFTTLSEQDEHLPSDPGYNSSTQESEHNSQSEEESEVDEAVDIETVEEILEKINIAHLKETATLLKSPNDKSIALVKSSSTERKKVSKVDADDTFSIAGDGETILHRRNHTANERKRRNEMRDLFEELKNALGLHNLPKVSKSYILKKAIEEIEGLTDSADSLIRQKTLMSQKQSQLIKKVSNLSGKPKDVVLKKLEYIYAKRNALEAEKKKKDLEEDLTLTASENKQPLPFPPLRLENEADDSSSSKNKPIILSRKHVTLSAGTQQPAVITSPDNILMTSAGQLTAVKETTAEQVAAIPPTLIQADVRPTQIPTGMASVVIQLPGNIQLKGIIGNSSVPITLSAVPPTISSATPSPIISENDDLSMMPKIVNVTSLAEETSLHPTQELGIHAAETDTVVHTLTKETAVNDPLSNQVKVKLPSAENLPSISYPLDPIEENHSTGMNITKSPDLSLPENLPMTSNINAEATLKSVKAIMNDSSLRNSPEDVRDSELELELKKLSSAIDEAEMEPSESSEVMGDHEDSDETLTSLLNEIALLNQQLNNDHSDTAGDFPGSVTPSRGSVGKPADGDSSPFFFGRFKELSEPKEKNISLSPFFLQLDEGENQDSVKHNEDSRIVVFEDVASKEPLAKMETDLLQPPANVTFLQAIDKPAMASSSDVFWRPMPKLAPLGLKSSNVQSDQRVLGNKSMPSLASAAVRLSPPKPMD